MAGAETATVRWCVLVSVTVSDRGWNGIVDFEDPGAFAGISRPTEDTASTKCPLEGLPVEALWAFLPEPGEAVAESALDFFILRSVSMADEGPPPLLQLHGRQVCVALRLPSPKQKCRHRGPSAKDQTRYQI